MIGTFKALRRILPATLAIALATASGAIAADFRVAVEQDLARADVTTHTIKSGDVTLGISEFGGGYINKLEIPGIGDILGSHAARYGRGGQVSIRDDLHGGRYNPTQAGFSDVAGTYCAVEQPAKGVLHIPPRPTALFNGDRKYDYTEWEDLARDPYPRDGGRTDEDQLDESRLPGKQADEITSEFDFTGSYEDVRDGKAVKIPAFRFSYEFRYLRPPGHVIGQFGRQSRVYDKNAEAADLSNLEPQGIHPATESSLANLELSSTLRGDKALWNPAFVFFVDDAGKFAKAKPLRGVRQTFFDQGKPTTFPLIVYSRSSNPDSGPAIGLFFPQGHVNTHNVVGRSLADHRILYEDARTTTGTFVGNVARTPEMWLVGARTFSRGLLAQTQLPTGVYEAIRGETYLLVGTPQEILEASRTIENSRKNRP